MSYKVKYHKCHGKYKKSLMYVSLLSIQRFVIGHPLGGTPGKYNFLWGLSMGVLNDHFTLQVEKMREVWFP